MEQKRYTYLVGILIILQPFLDLYFIYENPAFEIFNVKFSTIVRLGIVFIMGIIFLNSIKKDKNKKYLFIYGLLILLYILIHHINAQNFICKYPEGIPYNLITEITYIIRYLVPLIIILYFNKVKINKDSIKISLLIFSILVSVSSIISNIFYLARASYSNFTITYNLFDWFLKDYSYWTAASKGWFYAVSIFTTLLAITPIFFSDYLNNGKKISLLVGILNIFALMMVGTRSCGYGIIIILVLMLLIYLLFVFFKQESLKFKRLLTMCLLTILSLILFIHAPALNRVENISNESNTAVQKKNEIDKKETKIINKDEEKDKTEKDELINFLSENKSNLGIYAPLLDAYNYKYDPYFWINLINNEPIEKLGSNRYVEAKMLQRAKNINNNKLDDYFGITYSRTSNIYNLERDFQYQYYSLGLCGIVILMMPIVVWYISRMFLILKKKCFTMENISLLMGVGLIFAISIYSGDVFDNLETMIILATCIGLVDVGNKGKKKNENKKNN